MKKVIKIFQVDAIGQDRWPLSATPDFSTVAEAEAWIFDNLSEKTGCTFTIRTYYTNRKSLTDSVPPKLVP